ncbi:MAG: hypothetical protein JXB47_18120 [Anaerolineae bacterium]|nr:hypothetical protein [Anaerolineae bacterium]
MSGQKPASFRAAVAQGCLLGLVMAALWAGLGLGIYALIAALGGAPGLAVVCGAGGGPLIGSALVLWWWRRRYGVHTIAGKEDSGHGSDFAAR